MRILIFTILFLILTTCCFSQTYISLNPALTNDIGTLAEKSNLSFEIGRQWDVFSLGLDVGKTSLGNIHGNDTSTYLEIRPNLNVFQQGKFTNTFTAAFAGIPLHIGPPNNPTGPT